MHFKDDFRFSFLNKTLAKRLLELKDLQNICIFASRFNTFLNVLHSHQDVIHLSLLL